MFNFREELEKVKKEMPTDYYQQEAEKFLRKLITKLEKMDCREFSKIHTLTFRSLDRWIFVKTDEVTTICDKEFDSDSQQASVYYVLKSIILEQYPDDKVDCSTEYSFTISI